MRTAEVRIEEAARAICRSIRPEADPDSPAFELAIYTTTTARHPPLWSVFKAAAEAALAAAIPELFTTPPHWLAPREFMRDSYLSRSEGEA